jgi:hypothetical protein
MVTYYEGTLRCTRCDTVSEVSFPSPLGDAGATYRVGDCPGDDISDIGPDDGLLLVRVPEPNAATLILHSWTCPQCGGGNVAEVGLADGCVRSIESSELTTAMLERVHFIIATVDDMIERITGESIWTDAGLREDWLAGLRAALDAGKRW